MAKLTFFRGKHPCVHFTGDRTKDQQGEPDTPRDSKPVSLCFAMRPLRCLQNGLVQEVTVTPVTSDHHPQALDGACLQNRPKVTFSFRNSLQFTPVTSTFFYLKEPPPSRQYLHFTNDFYRFGFFFNDSLSFEPNKNPLSSSQSPEMSCLFQWGHWVPRPLNPSVGRQAGLLSHCHLAMLVILAWSFDLLEGPCLSHIPYH